ncbi:Quinolinate synthase A [bioreactor metagenome]|uniref:quinolinate synthase n=1 Tax=bioreactor metagenome TaxID=1076179 RepID=A0A644YCW0_9ZZZZ
MSLIENIIKLKKEKNALILAHYYQRPEIQDIADYVGDSYYLSKIAKESPEQLIVFCGVRFMAESAKILSPEKTILLPALDAGCPMADMAEVEALVELKKQHPNAAVVCYINSTAEVKAHCDVSVTSSNAIKILNKMDKKEIIFLPDKNLGSYLSEQMPDKRFILWPGFCITHRKVNPSNIADIKRIKPDALVLSHPECEKEVRALSDFIGSTSEIIEYATKSNLKDFVIVTEQGVLHELKKRNPDKNFYTPGNTMTCVNMKKTTLEDVYDCLLNLNNSIEIDEEIRIKALNSLVNMHNYAR